MSSQSAGRWTRGLGAVVAVAVAAVWAALAAGPVWAAPAGQHVVAGSAQFTQNGNVLTIVAANNTVIRYSSFNIATGQTVQFIQPNSLSRVLNYIPGGVPTYIYGSLLANGRVYIANPSGVYFGQGCVVNVGQLFAVGGHVGAREFLSGSDLLHITATGPVVNNGSLRGDVVGLLGTSVANHGSIIADSGLIAMAAGKDIYVGTRDGHFMLHVDQGAAGGSTTPANQNPTSSPTAATLGTGDLYSLAVQNTGQLKAKEVVLASPKGTVDVAGTVDASNATAGAVGGQVTITGEQVHVDHAVIDASGDAGGGRVLIGGDFHGGGGVPTAAYTLVGPEAKIVADALTRGDGGQVVVWSNVQTAYFGEISVRGGRLGGSGGAAEVSGKQYLAFNGLVDLSGTDKNGTLLLDPANITVDTVGVTIPTTLPDTNPITLVANTADKWTTNGAGTDVIAPLAITNALANGNVILEATNNILVNVPILSTAAGKSLTLQAGGGITTITGATLTLQGGSLTLSANDNGGGTATGAGAIHLGDAVNTAGGNATGGSVVMTTNGGTGFINLGGNVTTGLGTVSFTGPVRLTNNATVDTTNGGFATATNGANITFNNQVNADLLANNRTLGLNAGTAGVIEFKQAVGGSQALGNLTLTNAAGAKFDGNLTTGALTTFAQPYYVDLLGTTTITGAAGTTFLNTGLEQLGGSFLTAGQAVSFGQVQLVGNATVNTANGVAAGANQTFNGAVDADLETNSRMLGLNAGTAGVIDFKQAVGGAQALGNVTVTNAAGARFDGNLMTGALTTTAQPYYVELLGLTTQITNATTFNNTGAGGIGVELGKRLTNLPSTVTFTGGATFGSVTNALPVSMTGNKDTTVATGGGAGQNLVFWGPVGADSATNNRSLVVNAGAGGTIDFKQAVGGTQTLAKLEVQQSNGTTFEGAVTVTQGAGLVKIDDTQAGRTVEFDGNLTAAQLEPLAGTHAYNVSLLGATTQVTQAATMTSFLNAGTVQLGAGGGGSVLTFTGGVAATNPSLTKLAGTLETATAGTGTATFGPVQLLANTVVDTTGGNTVAGGANLAFLGAISGTAGKSLTLEANGGAAGGPAAQSGGVISMPGEDLSGLASLTVNHFGCTNASQVATMVVGGNLVLPANVSFGSAAANPNENLTVLGNLTFTAGGAVTTGVVSALGNIDLTGVSPTVLQRPENPWTVLNFSGNTYQYPDVGMVAGGTILVDVNAVQSTGIVRMADPAGVASGGVVDGMQLMHPIFSVELAGGGHGYVAGPAGFGTINPSNAVAAAVAGINVAIKNLLQQSPPKLVNAAQLAALKELNVESRDPLWAEVFGSMTDADRLVDDSGGLKVYKPRLLSSNVQLVLDLYRDTYYKTDGNGQQVSRAADLKGNYAGLWSKFAAANPKGQEEPEAKYAGRFGDFVAGQGSPEAKAAIADAKKLDKLLDMLHWMGLGRGEAGQSTQTLLQLVAPEGLEGASFRSVLKQLSSQETQGTISTGVPAPEAK